MRDATVWYDRQERRRLLLAPGCIAMTPTSVFPQVKRVATIGAQHETAKALGIVFPQTVLLQVEQVIQ